jgi:hypothetical protein
VHEIVPTSDAPPDGLSTDALLIDPALMGSNFCVLAADRVFFGSLSPPFPPPPLPLSLPQLSPPSPPPPPRTTAHGNRFRARIGCGNSIGLRRHTISIFAIGLRRHTISIFLCC